MGFATHLGPWLLGTVKNTTGTTVGTVANTGTTIVSQTFKKDYTATTVAAPSVTTIACLPAGAQILDIYVDVLTAFTGSTAANMIIGKTGTTNAFWTTTDITAAGRQAITNANLTNWAGAATTAAPAGAGIGSTDVLVLATLSPTVATVTAGTVQYTIVYAVKNSDGAPVQSTFNN
jgi:hypothetical protein